MATPNATPTVGSLNDRGQTWSGGRWVETVGSRNGTFTPPTSSTPSIDMASASPISSSEPIRAEENLNRANAMEVSKQLTQLGQAKDSLLINSLGNRTYSQSDAGQRASLDLDNARQSIKEFTSGDEALVREAGRRAGARYDPLINEAVEQRRQGLPKAVIAGGERGGFMSTQFAGQAALRPTEGENFIGVGGELENIASAYDRNISERKAEKQAAIAAAEAAERRAIVSGKREDYQIFQDAYDRAEKSHNDIISLQNEKIDSISKYETSIQARTKFLTEQEDRTAEGLAGSLLFNQGNNVSPETLGIIASQNGIDPGIFAESYRSVANADKQVKANLSNQYYSIARNIPNGETYRDPNTGVTVIGVKEDEPDIVELTQTVGGTEYLVRFDMSDPGKPVEQFRISLGPRWKGGTGGGGSGSGGGGDTVTTPDEALIQGAKYLDDLKQKGELTDIAYNWVVNSFAGEYGLVEDELSDVRSQINNRLEAIETARTGVAPQGSKASLIMPFDQSGDTVSGTKLLPRPAGGVTNKELFPGFTVPVPTLKTKSSATTLPGFESKTSTPGAYQI